MLVFGKLFCFHIFCDSITFVRISVWYKTLNSYRIYLLVVVVVVGVVVVVVVGIVTETIKPGASCSKLMMSLVNDLLKFQMAILQIHCHFLLKKM